MEDEREPGLGDVDIWQEVLPQFLVTSPEGETFAVVEIQDWHRVWRQDRAKSAAYVQQRRYETTDGATVLRIDDGYEVYRCGVATRCQAIPKEATSSSADISPERPV